MLNKEMKRINSYIILCAAVPTKPNPSHNGFGGKSEKDGRRILKQKRSVCFIYIKQKWIFGIN